jgi:hypothetical protein
MGPHSITSSSHHLSKSLVPAGESKFAGSPSKYRNFGLWSRVKLRRANYFAYQASPSFWATGLIQTGQCTDTGGSVNPALSGLDPSAGGTTRALKSSPSFQFGEASPGRILRLAVERHSRLPRRRASSAWKSSELVMRDTVSARSRSLRCHPLQRPLSTPALRKETHNGQAQIAGRSARPRTARYL